jgi:predicted DsbA family dithiol-disulfide isomerase
MEAMDRAEVVEFTDPWCSWAWGSEPKLRLLRWSYADRLAWRRVLADLVPPVDSPTRAHLMAGGVPADPAGLAAYWEQVSRHTRMPWPDGLRWVPTCSEVAGRAVIAAGRQGAEPATRLVRALRESVFIFGAPADTPERVVALAGAVPGLDPTRLAADLDGPDVAAAYAADRAETRRPNDYVRNLTETHEGKGNAKPDGEGGWRYVTPTLVLRGPGGEVTVPGWQPWERYAEALERVLPGSTAEPRPRPSPDEALTAWPLLTERELEFICGAGKPAPARATRLEAAGGPAWIDKADLRSR